MLSSSSWVGASFPLKSVRMTYLNPFEDLALPYQDISNFPCMRVILKHTLDLFITTTEMMLVSVGANQVLEVLQWE